MTNLSNEHRLKQNIRIASISEFNRIMGGMSKSQILSFDESFLEENSQPLTEMQQDNIHQILQGSTGGTYFIDDITQGKITDSKNEDILKNKLAAYGYDVPSTSDFILYFEGDNNSGSDKISKSSIKKSLTDKDVSFVKISKTVDGKEVEGYGFGNTGANVINNYVNKDPQDTPHRIINPTIGAISFLEGRFSIPNRGSDEINLFFNAIPTLEMSKCVPYISLIMVYGKAKSESNNMSLGSFLRYLKKEDDTLVVDEGIPLTRNVSRTMGNINSEAIAKQTSSRSDMFKNMSNEKITTAEAGIELFLSPQTLSNSNIVNETDGTMHGGNILEPIMPLMSLESFNVSIDGLGYGLYASKTATLKIHLHDRSRLADVAPLVSPEQFGETRIIIEYGWSHPDASINSGNPIGQFLGSLRDVGIFTVASSKMNFSGQGASIDIRLAMMGGDDSKSVTVACGKYVQGKIFKPQVESIIKRIQNDINPSAYDKNQMKEIRKKHRLSIREASSSKSIIEYDKYLEALKLAGLADGGASKNDEEFINYIRDLFDIEIDPDPVEESEKKEGFNPTETGMRLTDAIGSKIQSLFTVHDPYMSEIIIAQAKSLGLDSIDVAMSKEDFITKINDQFKEVSGITPYFWNNATEEQYALTEAQTGIAASDVHKQICTLGLLMTKFVAEPLITTSRYDQIQLCFYPINSQSAGARIYSTSSYPIIIGDFVKVMSDAMFKNPNITVNKFLNLVDRKIINDFENPAYGLTVEMEQKSKLRKLTKKVLKDLSDDELAEYGLPDEFKSIRDKIKVKDKKYSFNNEEDRKKFQEVVKKMRNDNKNSITNKLMDIYSKDNGGKFIGDPKFTIPDLSVYFETLPAIKPSNNEFAHRSDEEYDNKNILRIHVYDKNYSPNPELLHIKDLMASGDVTVEVNDDNPGTGKLVASDIMSLSAKQIKNLIKKRVPSITYGTSFCNATSFSLNGMSTSGGSIGNTLFLTALQNKDAPQAGHGGVSDIDDMMLMPMEASLECLGMPIINRGNQIYIDMSSNTTADNMYAVKNVSHSIKAGQFNTSVGLTFIAQNSIKDIRSKIQSVANSLENEASITPNKSKEAKKIAQTSQEISSKRKQKRHAFTND
jgi:hypothetical protein